MYNIDPKNMLTSFFLIESNFYHNKNCNNINNVNFHKLLLENHIILNKTYSYNRILLIRENSSLV